MPKLFAFHSVHACGWEQYVYTGKIPLEQQDGTDLLNLLMAADELILHDLFGYIQQHLITYKTQWMHENFSLVRRTVFQNDRLKRLQEYCVDRIYFYRKVIPYKDILPHTLFEEVMKYHMIPDCPRPTSLMPSRRGDIESNLLRTKHAALISSWIDHNDFNVFYNITTVLCSQAIGACFGSGDLVMGGTHSNFNVELGCSCKRQSYERPLMISNHDRFRVDEYEVLKVIPRMNEIRQNNVNNNRSSSGSSSSNNSNLSVHSTRGGRRFSILLSQLHPQ
ncbi:8665_t:CDS:2 [Diversispora eburnea]|uniref:8665_t:CDS:1 n=1 Tax=Diversispora eburnea TaxID=1213867 RepID=A0A9N9B6F6_9GLOM|nr:8665_t:CDS:2 [Diversispora eburnea]